MSRANPDEIIVYLVRHGETELNAAGRLRGRVDAALDATGLQQAEALGALFNGVAVRRVVASPLQRARRTAAPIARAVGAEIEVDDGLNDRDYGSWAGERQSEVAARFGSVDEAPGVERWQALARRLHEAFLHIVAATDSRPIVIVGHDAVNRALLATLIPDLAAKPRDIPQRTGCWNKLVRQPDGWRAVVLDARPGDGYRP